MTSWLLETLLWTAFLIAAVLVVRRPVAHWFGPQVAYALWAIPALRLVLPPLELPAWMRLSDVAPAAANEPTFLILDPATPVVTPNGPAMSEAAASDAPELLTLMPGVNSATLIELGIAVLLIGAAIFLIQRFSAYFQLRDQLLKDAVEVGREGKVRLVETNGTNSPLAFGVIDKVVALPVGFLAQPDRTARDLALAHEMAHHNGRDLLINVLVQPLFALHWFNPLGRYGWLALRRDQEAACDARVMAAKPAEEREAYANLIVSFAASPNIAPNQALAAPMACPVLGEKSIIHRLRSLKMNDTSTNRRMMGGLMLGAAVIALPLTATISYAANEAPVAPQAPAAFVSAYAPTAPAAPDAPQPPAPPAAPAAPQFQDETIIEIDPDGAVSGEERREERVVIVRTDDDEHGEGQSHTERRVERVVVRGKHGMSEEEREEMIIELRQSLAEADEALENIPEIVEEAMAGLEAAQGQHGRTVIRMSCDNSSDEVATTTENADGSRTVMLCQTRVMASALSGLREARESIANSREMSDEIRSQVLRELDQQIERWEDNQG